MDTLEQIDDTVEGRCAGPRCRVELTADSISAWFHSDECQRMWYRQRTHRPEEVWGQDAAPPSQMRWRPDLVSPFDDRRLELVDRRHHHDTDLDYLVYTHRDNPAMAHLRVEDDYRYVGMDVPWSGLEASGPSEVFRRLERKLTDPRRLDNLPPSPSVRRDVFRIRTDDCWWVYNLTDSGVLVQLRLWMMTNSVDPNEVVRHSDRHVIEDGWIRLECYLTDAAGQPLRDETLSELRTVLRSVPLVEAPPSSFDSVHHRSPAAQHAEPGLPDRLRASWIYGLALNVRASDVLRVTEA